MKKRIKQQGNSALIRFTSDEMDVHGWKVGDVLDLSDIVKIKEVDNNGNKKRRTA